MGGIESANSEAFCTPGKQMTWAGTCAVVGSTPVKRFHFHLLALLLFLFLMFHSAQPAKGWTNVAAKPVAPPVRSGNDIAIGNKNLIWAWAKKKTPPPPPPSPPKVIATWTAQISPFASDVGIRIALAMFLWDRLRATPNQAGKVARLMSGHLNRAVRFPGVAATICFLFSEALRLPKEGGVLGSDGWSWFVKAYPVYLFRFFVRGEVGFWQYAVEGLVGIVAAIKAVQHVRLGYRSELSK